jgi:hypothetical protein
MGIRNAMFERADKMLTRPAAVLLESRRSNLEGAACLAMLLRLGRCPQPRSACFQSGGARRAAVIPTFF